MKAQKPINITEGVIWKQLLLFFFPILYGTFFQQLYNTADAVIVGRFLGKEALAAVGGGTGTVTNLLIGFFTGLSSGATVIISQFYGGGYGRDVNHAVHTAIALSLAGGVVITAVGMVYAPIMLQILGTPNDILETAVLYIRIFFAGILPSIVYNMGAGILRAVGDSRRPFYFLVIGTVCNIALDLLFIAVFHWGVAGAAAASIVSQTITMFFVWHALSETTESYRLKVKDIRFDTFILKRIIHIGLPAGIQSVMYGISNLLIQANVNVFGTDIIAAWAAYGKIDSFYWMSINSFGIAITTFVGQNYGAHKIDRIRSGVRQCFLLAGGATVLISALFLIFGRAFYRLFTEDDAVVEQGMQILNFFAPILLTYISIEILSGTVRGCGKSLIPTLLTCGGVCALRIVWLSLAVPYRPNILTVCASYPVSWSITSALFIGYYLYLSRHSFFIHTVQNESERVPYIE